MNEIRQHIPAFVELDGDPEGARFLDLEELLAIPWVKNWSTFPGFHRFSLSDDACRDGSRVILLMAEFRGGAEWWVAGFLKDPVEGLPKWKHP